MTIDLPVPADFSFFETVSAHGWLRLLPFTWYDAAPTDWSDWRPPAPESGSAAGILERIERLPDGSVVRLRIGEADGAGLRVDVDPDERGQVDEIVRRVRRMLQLDIDIASFHAFARSDNRLAHIPERRQGRLLRSPTLFEDVIKVIATTNTTWSQTKGMVARLVNEFGEPLSADPARRAFPTPEAIAAAPPEVFADRARLGYRNAAVQALATDIAERRIDLESWQDPSLTADELDQRFRSLRGIGPYGAACLLLYLGRPVRVNVDSWARTMVGRELGRKVDDKDVHAFFRDYGEWRGLVYHFYAWKDPA